MPFPSYSKYICLTVLPVPISLTKRLREGKEPHPRTTGGHPGPASTKPSSPAAVAPAPPPQAPAPNHPPLPPSPAMERGSPSRCSWADEVDEAPSTPMLTPSWPPLVWGGGYASLTPRPRLMTSMRLHRERSNMARGRGE